MTEKGLILHQASFALPQGRGVGAPHYCWEGKESQVSPVLSTDTVLGVDGRTCYQLAKMKVLTWYLAFPDTIWYCSIVVLGTPHYSLVRVEV